MPFQVKPTVETDEDDPGTMQLKCSKKIKLQTEEGEESFADLWGVSFIVGAEGSGQAGDRNRSDDRQKDPKPKRQRLAKDGQRSTASGGQDSNDNASAAGDSAASASRSAFSSSWMFNSNLSAVKAVACFDDGYMRCFFFWGGVARSPRSFMVYCGAAGGGEGNSGRGVASGHLIRLGEGKSI